MDLVNTAYQYSGPLAVYLNFQAPTWLDQFYPAAHGCTFVAATIMHVNAAFAISFPLRL